MLYFVLYHFTRSQYIHKYAQFMEHLVLSTLDDDISLVLLFRLKKESAAAMVATVAATAAKVGIEPPMLI